MAFGVVAFVSVAERLILLLFLVSGAVGLGYQVLWSRYLLGFIGVSAYSYATVLASFMGGLALGSALLGRLADRVRSPLRLFALLEAGVGLYALVYPRLSEWGAALYGGLVSFAPERVSAGQALWAKALIAGLLLLVPTTLMGGTYPALVRHATDRLQHVGREASRLYSVNALGAAGGALLMAFVLMPVLGMTRGLIVLALANGLVAATALLLARGVGPLAEAPAATAAPEPGDLEAALTPGQVRLALALILVEGFLAFSLEIGWTRYFAVVLGSSTYSFALVLAAFLFGIALGSAWLSRAEWALDRPLPFFGWTQVLAGLAILVPLPLYPLAPWLFLNLQTLFSDQPAAFFAYAACQLLACVLVMLPPTLLFGMALPLLVKGLARDIGRLGSDTGRAYAWNTWGNVAGALLAGLVLLPLLGMEQLLRTAALGSAVLGLFAIGVFSPRRRATGVRVIVAATAVLAAALAVGPWQTEAFALRPTRRQATPLSREDRDVKLASYRTLLFKDDPAALLMVHATGATLTQETLTLSVNGKPDATSYEDLPTQILSGHLPLLLAPRPRDVLVIGLASGITAGAALAHPVRRLDVVEIVSAMPEASRLFREWNRDPLADPRVHLIVDDARSYLSHTRQRYDVVISEPSNPWMAGTGALFSREFYARAARALESDGVYLQWLQAYELSDETFAAVVRTFRGVFPHIQAFQGNHEDLLLLGSRRPIDPDWSELERRFEVPAVREDLATLRIESLATLLAFQVLSPASVDHLAAQTPLENTDDNLLLEYRAPRELFRAVRVSAVSRLDERLRGGPSLLLGKRLRQRPGEATPRRLLAALGDSRVSSEPLHEALRVAAHELEPDAGELYPFFAPPDDATVVRRLDTLVRTGRFDRFVRLLGSRSAAILLEAALAPERGRFWEQAVGEWLRPPQPSPPPEVRRFRIELQMAMGQLEDAGREMARWMEEIPGPEPGWMLLRACEIDRGPLCDAAVENAAARSAAPSVERLRALRAQARYLRTPAAP